MPYKKSTQRGYGDSPLSKKNLSINREIDIDSESGGYTGQPKQHGSPFEMSAKRYNNSPMQKNFGDSIAITKKLDKDSMQGGLTGQPSGETGKIGSGPFKKTKSNVKPTTTPKSKGSAKPIKFGDPSNKMRQRFQTNIKNFGPDLKTAGKDIKYKFSGKTGRTKMVTGGYKTPKQRRKPGASSSSTASNVGSSFKPSIFSPTSKFKSTTKDIKMNLKKTKGGLYDPKKTNSGGGGGGFKDAFATARKAHGGGGGTFDWKGKKYTTDIKSKKKVIKPPKVGENAPPGTKMVKTKKGWTSTIPIT